mmetsp:Transcript_30033/g.79255  ORF Transcript_30033/g.79255 Transcript_30033/m.79255 type:complete len:205 (-) Transcript_30033:594-1208(-)
MGVMSIRGRIPTPRTSYPSSSSKILVCPTAPRSGPSSVKPLRLLPAAWRTGRSCGHRLSSTWAVCVPSAPLLATAALSASRQTQPTLEPPPSDGTARSTASASESWGPPCAGTAPTSLLHPRLPGVRACSRRCGATWAVASRSPSVRRNTPSAWTTPRRSPPRPPTTRSSPSSAASRRAATTLSPPGQGWRRPRWRGCRTSRLG